MGYQLHTQAQSPSPNPLHPRRGKKTGTALAKANGDSAQAREDKDRAARLAREDESPGEPKFCEVCRLWLRNSSIFEEHLGLSKHRKRLHNAQHTETKKQSSAWPCGPTASPVSSPPEEYAAWCRKCSKLQSVMFCVRAGGLGLRAKSD